MHSTAPLWALCTLNDETLSEKTDSTFAFDYVDISNVTEGVISNDLESLTFATAPSRARRIARDGDVIVSTVRTYLRAIAQIGKAEQQRIYSTGFAVLRPETIVTDPRYVAYVLGSDQVMDEIVATSVGVSYPAIQGSALHRIRIPHHALTAQQRIADYLDRETGEIDAMIAKMDELAESLEARKSETRAVTIAKVKARRGLRWMSKNIGTGPFGTQVKENDYVEDGIPLINPSHIINGHIRPNVRVGVSTTKAAELSRFNMDEGDIVVARRGEFGRCAVVQNADLPVLCGTGSLWVKLNNKIALPEFVQIALSSTETIRALEQSSVGTTMNNLNERILGEISLPCPPLQEQRRIVDYLDEVTSKIDQMLAKVAELKSLLTERRAALITDVVTGRKEVA